MHVFATQSDALRTRVLTMMMLISLVLLNGCGTVIARSDSSPVDARYYPGTQGSLLLLGLDGQTGEASGEMVFCWMSVVCPLFTLIALPVDITLDTLLLPYDALQPENSSMADKAE
ncbi:YceK/YidQ family lipoprotein [Thalassolituus hydrocarboniclasticus]|uniref:YceK/YidQ family lipoprotein n=1 Tax=Thalassolituus hydrocarboniclasticus TaxID=2742796 RepID=A0ABY6A8F2_9GAMM|nr:YceK/YidQ family lipoprotein [Thalassolituus hydrocarboniclasticus]UXD86940.1 YceK/YidQ family lipoprotein [Thalassolituus hydrocarboniclasticus]